MKSKFSPWITSELRQKMRKSDFLKKQAVKQNSDQAWNDYKKARNEVNASFREPSAIFFNDSIKAHSSNHPRRPRGSQSVREKRREESFKSTGERAPGYRLSPDHFHTVKRMLVPHWAPKMLCIFVPNQQTISSEFFS